MRSDVLTGYIFPHNLLKGHGDGKSLLSCISLQFQELLNDAVVGSRRTIQSRILTAIFII